MSKWRWLLKLFFSKLWVRATLFCVVGILTALAGLFFKDLIPNDISHKVGADAVGTILHIIASSMLAVTTFSLSTMVAAYSAASSSTTPRSTQLLLEDAAAQNALSTFIGSFLFSLVGIIALQIGIYGDSGRLILFVVTLIVIFIIVAMMLQWIQHLSQLGRVGHTINMVERSATAAVRQRLEHPFLGANPLQEYRPAPGHVPVTHPSIGYIQYIDMEELSRLADRRGVMLYLTVLPGSFNDSLTPVLHAAGPLDDADLTVLRRAFSIGHERSFDQDPRFGLIVMSEIASRALSPAVNDPGTAIAVIGGCVRVLALWIRNHDRPVEVSFHRLFVRPLAVRDMFDDVFAPIGRDGAALLEVGIRLQKSYYALANMGDDACRREAVRHSRLSLQHAMAALKIEAEQDALAALALKDEGDAPR